MLPGYSISHGLATSQVARNAKLLSLFLSSLFLSLRFYFPWFHKFQDQKKKKPPQKNKKQEKPNIVVFPKGFPFLESPTH